MRIFFAKMAMLGIAVLCLLNLGAYGANKPDDGGKDTDSTAKPAPKTAPASKAASGLTEREQWMLDRIEQLEKELRSWNQRARAASALVPQRPPTPRL